VTAAALRDPGNALIAIANLAKATPSPMLVGIEAAGFAVALAIWIWAPDAWRFSLPFLSLSAYGIWGVIDHRLRPLRGRKPTPIQVIVFRPVQAVVALAGTIAAATAVFMLVEAAIGSGIY
jgi:hypothetical protein